MVFITKGYKFGTAVNLMYCVINNNKVLLILVQRRALDTKLACVSVAQYNTTTLNSVNNLVLYDKLIIAQGISVID